MKKLLLACSLVGFALPVFAEGDFCAQSPANAPQIPTFVETGAELVDLHSQVVTYVQESEKRLMCLKTTESYNALVDNMHNTANKFNKLLATYKRSASL